MACKLISSFKVDLTGLVCMSPINPKLLSGAITLIPSDQCCDYHVDFGHSI